MWSMRHSSRDCHCPDPAPLNHCHRHSLRPFRLTLAAHVLRVKRAAAVWRLMRAPKQNVKEFLEKRRRASKRKKKEEFQGEENSTIEWIKWHKHG